MNLAILIGISEYDNSGNLSACSEDVNIMKNIIDKIDKFDDICYIKKNITAREIKTKIANFINKYSKEAVNELFFYFSGHGYRNGNDFFYVVSDFNENKLETTSLRNTELDSLIKNLSPKLTIKVIDACYAGTQYIKSSEQDLSPILNKSAKENEFQSLYFLYSSDSNNESLANDKISFFSKSFFESLIQQDGEIRYRDIISYIADDMKLKKYPEPTFITQAKSTEVFANISSNIINYLNPYINCEHIDNIEKVNKEEIDIPNNLISLIKSKSEEEYCTKEEAFSNINILKDKLMTARWGKPIGEIFNIELIEYQYTIPNVIKIARWVQEHKSDGFFIEPRYAEETYFEEEYIEVPKNPKNRTSLFMQTALSHLYREKDYKLEKIEKIRQVLSGIEYKAETPFEALHIKYMPKENSIDNYSLMIVIIFSRKDLVIFSSIEDLGYKNWDIASEMECKNWKINKLKLKDKNNISIFIDELVEESSKFILEDIENKLK